MTCTISARRSCERAAAACDCRDSVRSIDVLAPAQSEENRWTVELHLRKRGVPPAVQRALADHGLTLRDVSPRATAFRAVAVLD